MSTEQKKQERRQAGFAAGECEDARRRAESGDSTGLLKLYEISSNDGIYTVEYSEIAQENIHLILRSDPELWIRTFATVDMQKFKSVFRGIGVSEFPRGVTSDTQFRQEIADKLENFKGNRREMELTVYLLGLCRG